jgi:hypothetical protein
LDHGIEIEVPTYGIFTDAGPGFGSLPASITWPGPGETDVWPTGDCPEAEATGTFIKVFVGCIDSGDDIGKVILIIEHVVTITEIDRWQLLVDPVDFITLGDYYLSRTLTSAFCPAGAGDARMRFT